MKLEVVVLPVADVERSLQFYKSLGWRLDVDRVSGERRTVHFTPPGSSCSILFGTNVTPSAPGTAQLLHLVVADIEAAQAELAAKGIEASGIFHDARGGYNRFDLDQRASGPDPERRTYASYLTFNDPDGNSWLLQEVTARLPGRIDSHETRFASVADLAGAMRRAAVAHGEHEKRIGGLTRIGPTGTPPTWWRNKRATNSRHEQRPSSYRRETSSAAPSAQRDLETGIGLGHGALKGRPLADPLQIGLYVRIGPKVPRREHPHGGQPEDAHDIGGREGVAGEIGRFAEPRLDLAVGAIEPVAEQPQERVLALGVDHLGDQIDHGRRHQRAIGEMQPEQIVGVAGLARAYGEPAAP
ncbi:MAG: VOC family protein [Aliidongia sp.]